MNLTEMCIAANIVTLLVLCEVGIALSFADHLCAGCVFANGAGYTNYTNCKQYVQCYSNGHGDLVGKVRECPFATYWNFEKLSCGSVETTLCEIDFCADKDPMYIYKSETNCRGYWECTEQGKSKPRCCLYGSLYDDKKGECVDDVKHVCEDRCMDTSEQKKSKKCIRFPVDGDLAKYKQYVNGFGMLSLDCPPGTLFDDAECECTNTIPHSEKVECKPEVDLTFDKYDTDESLHSVGVTNQNVEFRDGVAEFNGINSRLIIPRFTNLERSSTIVIRAWYTSPHQTFNGKARALVVNSDCDQRPTIMISEDNTNVYFGVGTNSNPFAFTHVRQSAADATSQKYVEYKFKNGKLFGNNGINRNSTQAPGVLRGVKCALQIGYADNMEYFNGTIKELTIYLCDPDK